MRGILLLESWKGRSFVNCWFTSRVSATRPALKPVALSVEDRTFKGLVSQQAVHDKWCFFFLGASLSVKFDKKQRLAFQLMSSKEILELLAETLSDFWWNGAGANSRYVRFITQAQVCVI